jgi:Zn-dependent metalloprotease
VKKLSRRRAIALASAGTVVTLTAGLLTSVMVSQASAEPNAFLSGDAGAVLSRAGVASGANPAALAVTPRDALSAVRTLTDADGSTHVRYARTYHGLRVFAGDLIVHSDPTGRFESASVSLDAPISLTSVRPTLTPEEAKAASRAAFQGFIAGESEPPSAARSVAPPPVGDTQQREPRHGAGSGHGIEEPELLVDASSGVGVLAYETVIHGTAPDGQTPSHLHVFVDAHTGEVLGSFDEVRHVDSTGHGYYTDPVPLDSTYAQAANGEWGYFMIDQAHGGLPPGPNGARTGYFGETATLMNLTMLQAQTDPNYLRWWSWYEYTPEFGDGTHTTDPNLIGHGTVMADVQYGVAETFDYFADVHGRTGIYGDGLGVLSLAHYGSHYQGAFWDGYWGFMAFGDGSGNTVPMTALDVVAHEFTHGVTEQTAGLLSSGEAGGLSEATSDIFATMVEFAADHPDDPADYTIREELPFGPSRYLYNPSLDLVSPNCWTVDVATMGAHNAAAIANHFFFLLAEGSGDTAYGSSPVCAGPALTGIGREAAAAIWYRALDAYFTPTTSYVNASNPTNTARAYTAAAAGDLFGVCSPEYRAVEAAWTAVNVGGFSVCDDTPATAAGAFVSLAPSRILDTRSAIGVPGTTKVPGGSSINLQVTGRGGVPASDVSAVVLNVTVAEPTSPGFITAYPAGEAPPLASNLNFVGGQVIPNLVTVKLGTGGQVGLKNGSAQGVHLIADVAGYYLSGTPTEAGTFVSLAPSRLLDTRDGTGVPAPGKVAGQGTVELQVAGQGGVPPTGAVAAVLNVTVAEPTASGFITAYPTGEAAPLASNLNFTAGKVIPNLVTVLLGTDGKVSLKNGSPGTSHLIADVAGYYLAGTPTVEGAFVALAPSRILDTRTATGVPGTSKVPGFGEINLQVTGQGGVPGSGPEAIILNVTVAEPGASGYITIYPTGVARPVASNLNFVANQVIPNLTITRLGSGGQVTLFNGSPGGSHLLADVAGYFL